jgi:DNA-binding response OmpR family regulator
MAEDSLKRRKILIVDDEERMIRFIRLNLEHDGFVVAEAFNGKQALQRLRDSTPDLILLDVMMPDLDGFEVLEMIREISSVPVIMLTAKGEEDDRVHGWKKALTITSPNLSVRVNWSAASKRYCAAPKVPAVGCTA